MLPYRDTQKLELLGAQVALFLLVILVSSCLGGRESLPLGIRCETNEDCTGDLICSYGACRSSCTHNRDCGPGLACVATEDDPSVRVCTFPSEAGCEPGTYVCPGDLFCSPIDELCHETCESDDDCYLDRVCRGGVCIEEGMGDCGDGFCILPENLADCPQDCETFCGNLECTADEDPISCPSDCPRICGDLLCTHNETNESCPDDCPEFCGNGDCETTETVIDCPIDCPAECGDGICSHWEALGDCVEDCENCGDGSCDPQLIPISSTTTCRSFSPGVQRRGIVVVMIQ